MIVVDSGGCLPSGFGVLSLISLGFRVLELGNFLHTHTYIYVYICVYRYIYIYISIYKSLCVCVCMQHKGTGMAR